MRWAPWARAATLAAFAALAAVCVASREWMSWLYINGAYYAMLAGVAYLGWVLRRALPASGLRPWPGVRWALFGTALAAIVCAAVRPQLRIVSDETNLLGIGRAMAEEHRVVVATQGLVADAVFTPLEYTLADRPLLHPLALSILDSAFGYHVWTAFALNFALLAALLAGVGAAAGRRLGGAGGVGCALLLLAQPLLPLTAGSAVYDLMNTCCLAAAAVALLRFYEAPGGAALAVLWTALVAALHVRHESAVFLPVASAGVLLSRRLAWTHVRAYLGLYLATPLLLLPRAMQLALYSAMLTPGHQVNDAARESVSLANLGRNLGHFRAAFDRFDLYLPYATLLNLAGVVGAAALAAGLARRRDAGAWRAFALTFGAALAAHLAVTAAYWGSDATYQISARYFLPTCLGLSALAGGALCLLPPGPRRWALPTAGAVAFLFYFPVATRSAFGHAEPAIRKLNVVLALLAPADPDRLVVVADFPGRYTANGYGAVSFAYFARHQAWFLEERRRGALRDVVFVQEYAGQASQPLATSIVAPELSTGLMSEVTLSAESRVRVSRLLP